jgi:L-ascorbate metabolism protein UlaG (beta-lactamase superfamily)
MEIVYFGHSSFKIKGKKTVLVTDPFSLQTQGMKIPSTVVDVVTVSHQHKDNNCVLAISGNPLIISGPGEYEVKGTKVVGIAAYHDSVKGEKYGRNTIYRIETDGISLAHLGDKLDDKDVEILDGIDILMIPVGGMNTISTHEAVEIISQLEPKIIIPMYFKAAGPNQAVTEKADEMAVFLKEMGKEGIKPQTKLVISKDKLPAEQTIVILES